MKEIKIIVTPKNGAILTIKFDKFNLFSFKYAEDKAPKDNSQILE